MMNKLNMRTKVIEILVRFFVTNCPFSVYSKLVPSDIHVGGQTVGGSVLGRIHPNEFYIVFPNEYYTITHFKILFLDGSGNEVIGYIERCAVRNSGSNNANKKRCYRNLSAESACCGGYVKEERNENRILL